MNSTSCESCHLIRGLKNFNYNCKPPLIQAKLCGGVSEKVYINEFKWRTKWYNLYSQDSYNCVFASMFCFGLYQPVRARRKGTRRYVDIVTTKRRRNGSAQYFRVERLHLQVVQIAKCIIPCLIRSQLGGQLVYPGGKLSIGASYWLFCLVLTNHMICTSRGWFRNGETDNEVKIPWGPRAFGVTTRVNPRVRHDYS